MKKLTLCIVGLVVGLLPGCKLDEVYAEKGDITNGSPEHAEHIGTLRAMVIKGTISSAGDTDYYHAEAGSANVLRYEVFYNGKSQITQSGVSDFPFWIETVGSAGQSLSVHDLAAGASSEQLPAGTASVWFVFHADQQRTSGAYELHLE